MPNWNHVLREIEKETDDRTDSASDKIRRKYLMELHNHVDRNIICYYSGWLSKSSKIEGLELNDEDKNGFMLCIHKMDRKKGLDLFLHTPGGSGAATASLVDYLKQMFGNDIRAFIPQISMSAGAMIACACKQIYMGKHSNIGPVDPQINGIPAYAVIEELNTAYEEIKNDPARAYVWNPVLSRYTPGFVQRCHWAIQHSKAMVADFLKNNMFESKHNKDELANKVVETLTAVGSKKGHDNHIHYQQCVDMGLDVVALEDNGDKKLQDLVLTVHHCYMYTLSNTGCFKIVENHTGRRYVKVLQQVIVQTPVPAAPAAPPAAPTP